MNFIEASSSALKNYARFSGRAPRSEYWYFFLFYMGVVGVAIVVDRHLLPDFFVYKKMGIGYAYAACYLGLLIPSFAVCVRRLHDVGKSGWWWFLFPTIIGWIPLIYWTFKKGTPGTNRYGKPVQKQSGPKNWTSIGLSLVAAAFAACPFIFIQPTSLVSAAELGKRDAVIRMLDAGADVNEEGLFGMTPLVGAIVTGHTDIAILLIEKGADFNRKGANGVTPLYYATALNNVELVALLLKKGASVEDADTGAHPALDLAVQKGYKEIADMLQKASDK